MMNTRPRIIVATPGRLNDHINKGTVDIDDVRYFVLDEADMMFDMGFAPQVEQIMYHLPHSRQTLLFSATMPETITRLIKKYMKLPVRIEIAPSGTTADNIEQEVYVLNSTEKMFQLNKILKNNQGQVIIFVRTKHGAKKLSKNLRDLGFSSTEIHSNLSLNARKKSLDGFKKKTYRILVGTDIAARGIDVTGVELVLNYDLPEKIEDYVHRIGRTGRAGAAGKAISFASPQQAKEIRQIEKLINNKLPMKEIAVLENTTKAAVSKNRKDRKIRRVNSGIKANGNSVKTESDNRQNGQSARPKRKNYNKKRSY